MIEKRLGDFEETILLMVGILGEEAYAFKIVAEFESQSSRVISIGTVHSTLNRLENKGFLSSEFGKPTAERGGRRKRIYAITAYGRKILAASRDFKLSFWNQYSDLAIDNLNYGM